MDSKVITVLVVDDQTLLRDTLCDVLAQQPDIKVVGGVANDELAARVAAETRPDIILLDGAEPREIIATAARLRNQSPDSHCIILTAFQHPLLIKHALRLRVSGFLTKSLNRHEVLSVIRMISAHPEQSVLSIPKGSASSLPHLAEASLSARELQIMEYVAQGLSNSQIASRLAITEATVKRHLRNIFEKLGAASRIDAVNKAKSMLMMGLSVAGGPVPRRGAALRMRAGS
ncbi:response regulator transcription factor [Streptomyces halobius]|uniref:Response regulator transcription factor n=1 Tax=Streptomyces halobius TaxID=2879846 RepID=A0ABY4M8B5_9ACTN|nr:response regulator transcription factor [Streptomyces halobius]UQA92611.1 response regulator transcription factor [Streptomyces halobius]